MGKDFSIIDKNSTEVDLIVKWSDMYNIAQNLFNTSDLGFLRFFRLLYKMDKRFLALFIRNHKNKLSKKHYFYAKDCFSNINISV